MADLDVQPKKRGSIWPWIILLLIAAAIAYFLLRDEPDAEMVPGTTTTDTTYQGRTDTTP